MYQNVAIPKTCALVFEVFDDDNGKDDFLGKAAITFDSTNGLVTPGHFDQQGFKVIECELKDRQGKVVIRKKTHQASTLKLRIKLHQAVANIGQQQMMGQPTMNQQYPMGQQGMSQHGMGQQSMGQHNMGQQGMGQPMMNQPYPPAMGNQGMGL